MKPVCRPAVNTLPAATQWWQHVPRQNWQPTNAPSVSAIHTYAANRFADPEIDGYSCRSTHVVRLSASANPKNPAFQSCKLPLLLGQRRLKVLPQESVFISFRQPPRDTVGILLIGGPIVSWKSIPKNGGVNFGNNRLSVRHIPDVEWPDVILVANFFSDPTQPGKAGMSRLGNTSLHIKLKDRLCR